MRLIDADAILNKFEWKEDGPLYIRAIRTMIEAAPTIYAVQHTDDVIQRMQDIEQAQIEKAYDLGYAEGEADAEPQWIPCGERLPEAYQPVLRTVKRLCWEDGTGFGTWLDVDVGTYNTNDGSIVAWMPLPKPYEERKEE